MKKIGAIHRTNKLTTSLIWLRAHPFSIFMACSLVIFVLVAYPLVRIRLLARSEPTALQTIKNTLEVNRNKLSNLPGLQFSIDPFTNNVAETVSASRISGSDIQRSNPRLPNRLLPFWGVHEPYPVVPSAQPAVTHAWEAQDQASKLLAYQEHTLSALQKLMAYNPAVDLAKFDENAEDTTLRLERAKQGITESITSLTALKDQYSDPSLSDVITSLKTLQLARDELARDHNVAQWVDAVHLAQISIAKNRQDFWTNASALVANQFTEAISELSDIQSYWASL